jgi:hypothetical protein
MLQIKHEFGLQAQIRESLYWILLDASEGLWDSLDVRRAHLQGRRLDKKPKRFTGPLLVKIGRNTASQSLLARNKSYRALTTLPGEWEPVFDQKLIQHACLDLTGCGAERIKWIEKELKRRLNLNWKEYRYSTSEYYQFQTMEQVLEFKQAMLQVFVDLELI